MSCKCAKYDIDEGRYYCSVTGDQCVYLIPDSKRCAEDYGEGPDAEDDKVTCPNGCHVQVSSKYDKYCPLCGQKIDWDGD